MRQTPDGGRIRLALDGELDLSNVATVEAPLLDALGSGKEVVVDLGQLEFIDSTGISLLVMAMKIRESGLSFVPCRSLEVRRVLNLTGLDERMPFEAADRAAEGSPSLPA
ncbi:MAG TPA: STAS domain-containing protein [Solirubrobacterales bacterium]|nr:STAS domain-containing protein [Solirubrobacterales bacterium]